MLELMQFLFVAVPVAMIVAFFVCLARYQTAKKQNKQQPGSVDARELKMRKILMIVFAVISGVIVAVVLGFVVLLFLAIAFM